LIQASGFPAWVQSADDETKYLDDFEASEGIRLDRDAVIKNSGKRGIGKLMNNTLWASNRLVFILLID
jgi:hypothetical protein